VQLKPTLLLHEPFIFLQQIAFENRDILSGRIGYSRFCLIARRLHLNATASLFCQPQLLFLQQLVNVGGFGQI